MASLDMIPDAVRSRGTQRPFHRGWNIYFPCSEADFTTRVGGLPNRHVVGQDARKSTPAGGIERVISIFIFISGATLLVYSAERLIGSLVGVSRGLAISVFL